MSENLLPAESWTDGVEQPDVIVNDNARRLEVAILPALSFESTEPGSPAEGDLYVLSAAWGDGDEHDLAYYFDGAWTFWTPFEGQIKDIAGSAYRVESGAWAIYAAGSFAPVAIQFLAETGSTADSDPGAGLLKWNHATQASATQLYLDDLTNDGASLTGLWAALSAGGFVYLQHATDPDVWQIWDVTAVVDATGYAKLSVALLAKSTANFADADPMLVMIEQGQASSGVADGDYGDITVSGSGATWTLDTNQPAVHTWALTQTFTVSPVLPTPAAGDTGTKGATTAFVRTPAIQSVASSATVTPTFSDDEVIITAQAAGLTLANPTGTAIDGAGLVIRIKDNGTARSIAYGTQYRAIGVTLPTTTVISKTLYLGLIYNATDTKWDVVAVAQEA